MKKLAVDSGLNMSRYILHMHMHLTANYTLVIAQLLNYKLLQSMRFLNSFELKLSGKAEHNFNMS